MTYRVESAEIIVPVRDVARSVAFYRDVLDFAVELLSEPDGFAVVRKPPAAFQLLQTDETAALEATRTNISVYFRVTGLDAVYAGLADRLKALPEGRVRPPFDQPYGMREFHVKDPDGCLIFFGEPV